MVSKFGVKGGDEQRVVSIAMGISYYMQFPSSGFEFFLMLIWALWKQRNNALWNGNLLPPHEIVLRAEGWLHEFLKWHKTATKKTNKVVHKWSKPGLG